MKQKNKISNKMIGVIVIITLIILTSICSIVLMNNKDSSKAEFGTTQNATSKQIKERLKNKVDPKVLAISMNQSITMKNGKEEAILNIENMPENNYDMEIEIRKNENKERIYYVDKISPGYIIRKDKLEKPLKKGTHLCNVTFRAYDDKGNEVKSANAQIQIIVEE